MILPFFGYRAGRSAAGVALEAAAAKQVLLPVEIYTEALRWRAHLSFASTGALHLRQRRQNAGGPDTSPLDGSAGRCMSASVF